MGGKDDLWAHNLFTNKDANLTKAYVKYLEARFVQIANKVGRMALENGTAPQLPALPIPDRDAMEEFLEPARILLGALGFLILQPPTRQVSVRCLGDGPRGRQQAGGVALWTP